MASCNICKKDMDVPNDVLRINCGGECLQCMAESGDTDCVKTIIADRNKWYQLVTKIGSMAKTTS